MKRDLQPSEGILRLFFAGTALLHLGLGIWLFASPHSFFTTIGAFGPYNRPYEGDVATFYLALGVAGWIAASRATWRVPALGVLTMPYVLHSTNPADAAERAHNFT